MTVTVIEYLMMNSWLGFRYFQFVFQVELALFDTAGQEEYDQLRPLMYPETDVVVVCYGIDSPDSLSNTYEKWSKEVQHFCPGVPIILVGNKKDLRNNEDTKLDLQAHKQKPVSFEEGNKMAQVIGASAYIECSALTKAGVMDLFETAARAALRYKCKQRTQARLNCCAVS